MATNSVKAGEVVSLEGETDVDEKVKIAEALRLVAELEAAGIGRPRFNLASPYSRRTTCSASED